MYGDLLRSLRNNYSSLFANFFGFNLWVGGWTQLVVLMPFFLAGPRLFDFDHPVDMGVLVQVADAFQRVFSAMSVGMNNWAAVNDFRSVLRRLREFEAHLPQDSRGHANGATHGAPHSEYVKI